MKLLAAVGVALVFAAPAQGARYAPGRGYAVGLSRLLEVRPA